MRRRKERTLAAFTERPVARIRPSSKGFDRRPMEETLIGKAKRIAVALNKACKRAVHGMSRKEPRRTPVPLEVVAKMYSASGVIAAKKEAA